jgi:hypothetical protein
MSIFEFIIFFIILKRVVLRGLKHLLFLATNEVGLGKNKFMSYLGELLEMIFKINPINLI